MDSFQKLRPQVKSGLHTRHISVNAIEDAGEKLTGHLRGDVNKFVEVYPILEVFQENRNYFGNLFFVFLLALELVHSGQLLP